MTEQTPLQRAVRARLDELDISSRQAAARSQGLLTHATLSRIANAYMYAPRLTARTISGLALALDVPESRIKKWAAESAPPDTDKLAREYAGLPAASRAQVMALVTKLAAEEEKKRKEKVRAERPFHQT